ncbi:flagellar hook-associated protein 3 FlgL [Nitrosomonas aestuarii]|uniref:Flagellar hook-associated protein 3 FlgL n=1 Tax=Nitrosomonas aestuarii TaxID=52441 RepID=A0A1I4CTN0_9PROT|nr:flagellar hook-associated protein FlgL [Nitrosomonas aestuarii]SFK84123.1 flagellar hook-associated protein 3 FlgL [Nitrosomonas aestuarii]
MRVSTNGMYDSGTIAMLRQQDALIKTQQQISTGRRILTPADDPIAAAQALNVSQAASINSQYSVNRGHALTSLGLVETTLQSITSNLQDVRQVAVNAGNPTLSDTDRKSLAIELRGHFEALLGQANITDGTGNYLFSGFQENTQPFTHKGFNVQYNGDQGQRLNQVGPSRQIAVSNSGTDVFERIKNGNGIFVTAANATNTGSGVINSGSVTAPASLTGHSYDITFSVSGNVATYDIVDTTSGATLSSGNAFANNNTISFDGLQFSIKGDPANGDKFTVSPSTNQSIFTTIGNLITTLEAPSSGQPGGTQLTNNLNSALQNLDNSLENILSTRASVGSRLQEVEALESMGEDFEVQYEQRLSELRDVDFAKAISDLNRQQVYLEAAQKSFATVTGLSLFDFI